MMGVRGRIVLGVAAIAAALAIPAVAAQGAEAGFFGCQPTTIESMFPSEPPDAPSFSTQESEAGAARAPAGARCAYAYGMTFPVAVEAPMISFFGADRDGGSRKHLGVDIAAPKLTPVVAVADGIVSWIRNEQGGDCCALGIRHDDGWRSNYIHLNNDTYGSDDGLGYGLAPGIELGTRVTAGQVIGFIGDSGNAEATVPHVHFELRTPANIAIDPAASVRLAARNLATAPDGVEAASGLFGSLQPTFIGAFMDDDASRHAAAIDALASVGVVGGCGSGLAFCPDAPATGTTITSWLQRALDVAVDAEATIDYGAEATSIERSLLDHLSAALSTDEIRGCGDRRYCSDDPLSRGEFAALVVGILQLDGPSSDVFIDDEGHPFESAIDLLARDGIVSTCTRPTAPPFEPDRAITRGEVATFVARIVGITAAAVDCSGVS